MIAAINAGVAWLKAAAIMGQEWVGGRGTPGGRHLEAKAGAGPIWACYYSISTGLPVFGDRDKTIHALSYIAGTTHRVPRDARVLIADNIISLVWFE